MSNKYYLYNKLKPDCQGPDIRVMRLNFFDSMSWRFLTALIFKMFSNPIGCILNFHLFGARRIVKNNSAIGYFVYSKPARYRFNFDVTGNIEISYYVVPAERGCGYAKSIINFCNKKAISYNNSVIAIVRAENKSGNKLCLSVFKEKRAIIQKQLAFIHVYKMIEVDETL